MNAQTPMSPFIPGTRYQYAWDSTSLGYLKTCPRLYYYIMIEGWTLRDENVHLYFGQMYHSALESYDRMRAEGKSHDDAQREMVSALLIATHGWDPDPDTKAGKYKNRNTLLETTIWYTENFRGDLAQTFILANGKPAVEMSFKFELDWGPAGYDANYILCGHLDRIVVINDELYGSDRKTTTSTLSGYYFAQFNPNNQMSIYTLAGEVVIKSPLRGMMIDACQIKLRDGHEFARNFTLRTKDQLNEWVEDLKYWLSMAATYAKTDYWPMNDTACDKFGGCRFRGVCSRSPSVRQNFLKADFVQLPEEERWNPLKPR